MAKTEESLSETKFLLEENTDFNADSIEWCPFDDFDLYFVCGTYHLNEEKTAPDDMQNRDGNIVLYKLTADSDKELMLDRIDVFPSGGILDLKWCPVRMGDSAVLGAACSNGNVLLCKMRSESACQLQSLSSLNLSSECPKMMLSLDWSTQEEGSLALISSDTKGNLNFLKMRESELYLVDSWNAHSFESWICSFNSFDSHVAYSGGDDCCFKGWDTRNPSSPSFINRRHSMGVTAISKSKKSEHLLVTGSYDEHIFLWDTRKIKLPLSEINVGGGVWRLKWHPDDPQLLLSASMHNGFHVMSLRDGIFQLKVHYNRHKSLAYGVDWSVRPVTLVQERSLTNASHVMASCSFYDKLINVWKINA